MPGATPYYQKAKDVFIQRRTSDGKFEEWGIIVQPNSWLVCDPCNNIIAVPFSEFSASIAGTSSYAYTASYYSGSISNAEFSISSSYANTASWAFNSVNGGTTIVTGSTYPITASWAVVANSINFIPTVSVWSTQSLWATNSLVSVSSSWASRSLYADSVPGTVSTGSTFPITASWAVYAQNGGTQLVTGSTYPITSSWATIAASINFIPNTTTWATQSLWATASIQSVYSSQSQFSTQSLNATYSIRSTMATQSLWATQSVYSTQSLNATYSIRSTTTTQSIWATQSLFSTTSLNSVSSSWASGSYTASYLPVGTYQITSSWAENAVNGGTTLTTGSLYPITSSWAKSASYWDSASIISLIGNKQNIISSGSIVPWTASWATISLSSISSSWSSQSLVAISAPGTVSTGSTFPITASWTLNSISSSYTNYASSSLSSSYSLTSSYVINGSEIIKTKSGVVNSSSFSGTPQTYSIVFVSPFTDNNYSVTITGEDSRNWIIENKSVNGFVINSNSSVDLIGNTFWQAIVTGEFN